jgi:hypothetical protein
MGRHGDHSGPWVDRVNLPDCVEPAAPGHLQVHQDHVGVGPVGRLHGLGGARRDLGPKILLQTEHHAERLGERPVVVHHQHRDDRGGRPPLRCHTAMLASGLRLVDALRYRSANRWPSISR